jgi:hypothetical protein
LRDRLHQRSQQGAYFKQGYQMVLPKYRRVN